MSKYLNVILTVNAVLLAALVWTQVADRSVLSSEAQAMSPPPRKPVFLADGASQRNEMIKLLRETNEHLSASRSLLESGNAKVTVLDLNSRVTRNR